MSDINTLFFQLLQVSIGIRSGLSHVPSADDWRKLCAIAKRQSLLGICFAGVQKLSQTEDSINHKPYTVNLPMAGYLRWTGLAAKIQQKNELVTRDIAKVRAHFDYEGFDMVLLKGQGNLCNYPENLRRLRTSGDIDAWVMPKDFENMPMKNRLKNDEFFLRWIWNRDKRIRHCYIHVNYSKITETQVEVHFRPSYLNSPIRNIRFQRWMMEQAAGQVKHVVALPMNNGEQPVNVAVPTCGFNLVYQLSHLYRHIFDDGLGLRQVMDYYFLLCNSQKNEDYDEDILHKLIRDFGMQRFASALMYVLHEVFRLDEGYFIGEADKDAGEFLLREIMMAGNFGRYDSRVKMARHENGVQRLLRRQKRNMRFFNYYAEEVMCVPIYRVYQEYWRIKMNLKCK